MLHTKNLDLSVEKIAVYTLLVFLMGLGTPEWSRGQQSVDTDKVITRIAFGSCAVQDQPQPIWESVNSWKPQLFLFLGDNIYGDTENMDTLRHKYGLLADKPGFQKLRKQSAVLATWDDHDYGENDAGKEYPEKEASEEIFMDFWDVSEESPVRERPGVYSAQVYGPPGKRVQIILLDTRYFRDSLETRALNPVQRKLGYGPYAATTDSSRTMLGAQQWQWLEKQLEKPADLRLIGSSIQVVSAEHGWEVWGNMPHEKQRLFDLIDETGASGVVFLSGDVHWGELSRYDGNDYPLYDFTSSGINQGYTEVLYLPNQQRVGPIVYPYPNFGTIEIDWSSESPRVKMMLRDINGKPVLKRSLSLNQLKAR